MGKNIEEALKQSMKWFVKNDRRNQKGIAAIDLTSLLNPSQEFLITDDLKIISASLIEADQVYSPEVKRLFGKYGEHYLSVIFHWRIPVFHLKKKVWEFTRGVLA